MLSNLSIIIFFYGLVCLTTDSFADPVTEKITELEAKIEALKTAKPKTTSTTYINWGKASCPQREDVSLIYTGFVAGRRHTGDHSGSGTNWQCMSPKAESPIGNSSVDENGGLLYSAEYEFAASSGFRTDFHDRAVFCSVCAVKNKSTQIMIPGTRTCPAGKGLTQEYQGFLMSAHYTHKVSTYICVNDTINTTEDRDNGTDASTDHALLYRVEFEHGQGDGVPQGMKNYPHNHEVSCVVCSK